MKRYSVCIENARIPAPKN